MLDSQKQVNLWKLTGFVINDSNPIFLSQDSWSTIRYKSRISFVRHKLKLFGVRICDHKTKQIHGFAKRIHVFTNLLYDSRILNRNILSSLLSLKLKMSLYVSSLCLSSWDSHPTSSKSHNFSIMVISKTKL